MGWTSFIKDVFRGNYRLAPTTWFMGILTVVYAHAGEVVELEVACQEGRP